MKVFHSLKNDKSSFRHVNGIGDRLDKIGQEKKVFGYYVLHFTTPFFHIHIHIHTGTNFWFCFTLSYLSFSHTHIYTGTHIYILFHTYTYTYTLNHRLTHTHALIHTFQLEKYINLVKIQSTIFLYTFF